MKTNRLRFAARTLGSLLGCFATTALLAAPLTETTAIHTKPDASSLAISSLKAGSEPVAAPNAPQNLPAGWMAVEVAGPFQVYVQSKDLTKTLDPKPGSPAYLTPRPEAGVLTNVDAGDKVTMTGTLGRWMQFNLEKSVVGYIQIGAKAPATVSPMTPAPLPAAPSPMTPAPAAPVASGSATPGQPAPIINVGDTTGAMLPRQFAGKFVTTRRALSPRRPYEWALNDEAGRRYAYLDVSRLLLTDQIEKYANHMVVVFGTAKTTLDTKDLVIAVETLQLK
ncbi:MAG: hypothetical protein ABIZ49_11495 [Opitutaceae bacterium]